MLFILGANNFNNEVLSEFLESQTGFPCRCVTPSDLPTIGDQFADKPVLILLDCAAMGSPRTCDGTCLDGYLQNRDCRVICFNVVPDLRVEESALSRGVRGIIYDHRPLDLFPRAVRAVLDGQLWYPRAVLERHLMNEESPVPAPGEEKTVLTRREKEILNMLASGLRNGDIARTLCISPHTVKTHAYNLYKKIHVTSRFQAARWLAGKS